MTTRLRQALAVLAALGMLHASVSKAARPYNAPSADQPQDTDDEIVDTDRQPPRPARPPRQQPKRAAGSTATAKSNKRRQMTARRPRPVHGAISNQTRAMTFCRTRETAPGRLTTATAHPG